MNDISNQVNSQQPVANGGKKKHVKKGSIDGNIANDRIGSLLLDDEIDMQM
jgi:hypothetical protein